ARYLISFLLCVSSLLRAFLLFRAFFLLIDMRRCTSDKAWSTSCPVRSGETGRLRPASSQISIMPSLSSGEYFSGENGAEKSFGSEFPCLLFPVGSLITLIVYLLCLVFIAPAS